MLTDRRAVMATGAAQPHQHGGPWRPCGAESWEDLVSTRTFDIPTCKGFMLHIDNPEVRELFEPGREIDLFASEDALIAKIEHYLARAMLRGEMIEEGATVALLSLTSGRDAPL